MCRLGEDSPLDEKAEDGEENSEDDLRHQIMQVAALDEYEETSRIGYEDYPLEHHDEPELPGSCGTDFSVPECPELLQDEAYNEGQDTSNNTAIQVPHPGRCQSVEGTIV